MTLRRTCEVRHTVGVADMKISREAGDLIVTHALGSCLGITAHDPVAGVGGMLHVMLPDARTNAEKAKANPYMFVDTGVPAFFRALYEAGAAKPRLVLKVAGGANVNNIGNDRFKIGKRNYVILKKLLWKNSVIIEGEDVGGNVARTMYLDIATGRVWLSTAGEEKEL
jgi:chemotaxis protein CheD